MRGSASLKTDSPKPRVSDGVILFGTIALMGAPVVIPNLSAAAHMTLFYGGLLGIIVYPTWRWGHYVWRRLHPNSEISHSDSDLPAIENSGQITGGTWRLKLRGYKQIVKNRPTGTILLDDLDVNASTSENSSKPK